jgi:hypothetical protein
VLIAVIEVIERYVRERIYGGDLLSTQAIFMSTSSFHGEPERMNNCILRPLFELALRPGEGELKLISWLNEMIVTTHRKMKVVVCGSDSDIFIQCLLHPLYDRIYITSARCGKAATGFTYCDVDCLARLLRGDDQTSAKEKATIRPVSFADRADIAFACIVNGITTPCVEHAFLSLSLGGNDYLPKIRGGSGLDGDCFKFLRSALNSTTSSHYPKSNIMSIRNGEVAYNFEELREYFRSLSGGREQVQSSNSLDQVIFKLSDSIIGFTRFWGLQHQLQPMQFLDSDLPFSFEDLVEWSESISDGKVFLWSGYKDLY